MNQDRPSAEELEARLIRRIQDHTAIVGVIGLGYVGLPLALAFSEAGLKVIGFDVDARKVDTLNAVRCCFAHIAAERVVRAVRQAGFEASRDFDRLGEPDALVVCVPTPLTRQREPDTHFIADSMEQIQRRLRRGQVVILESTTYPGTTEELVLPILGKGGLRVGEEFFLAYSPEREDPGNRSFETASIPKVVGGVDARSTALAERLYRLAVKETVAVPSARAAEAVKLTENIFRCVNIALVNELKVIYDTMGIDIWRVLDAAETKPFGFMRFNPGPGLGGHCIPIDPFYLAWKAREYDLCTRFIELAGEVNLAMPRYVVGRLQDALNDRARPLRGSRLLLLGVAYKKDIDDVRESPSLELMHLLRSRGADVSYHDPHVRTFSVADEGLAQRPLASVPLTPASVAEYTAVLIATDHTAVDYEMVRENARLVVDTRGIYRDARQNVVRA